MSRSNTSIPISDDEKNVMDKRKNLSSAILGVCNSHGVKLSVNMTSEDKKELLSKLEEWRKIRKEKLAASILAKQKQAEKAKLSMPPIPFKSKPSVGGNGDTKLSVFERLYQNNGKIKKPEVSGYNKQQTTDTNSRKSTVLLLDKTKKPKKDEIKTSNMISKPDSCTEIKEKPVETSEENSDSNSECNNEKAEQVTAENCSVEVSTEKSKEVMELTKPVCPINDHIKKTDANSLKNAPAFKGLPIKTIGAEKDKTRLRRSISMVFRQKSKTKSSLVRRSFSAKNLHEMSLNIQKPDHKSFQVLKPLNCDAENKTKNEVAAKSVSFATPKKPKLTSIHLRTKLEDWLKVNGHSLEEYRHLRCFGITNPDKPTSEISTAALDESSENSYYATAPNTPDVDFNKENVTPPTVIQQADVQDVGNWLKELHRLIVQLKYPAEQCEEWLAAIRKKYTSCLQLPIYWECLAALNESKGDLKSAIEDYERAIIKGGEVDTVGESLAQLFDKMVIEQKNDSKPKLEKGLDPKNVFKSTIIKFALQQKAIKKLSSKIEPGVRQQLYVATPVRRSSRLQTPFKSNNEIASLQNLTPEFRENVTFKPNESLLSRD